MLKKFGSGRFCSSSCANSRKRTVEEIEKIKTTLMHTLLNKKQEEKVLDTTKNNIRGFYDDVYMASGYELIFYLYCKENNIIITRYPYRFCYEYNGMKKVYIPDFYLPESDKIIELKGRGKYYNEELVAAKTQCVKEHNYKIIYDDEIESYYK